MGLYAKLYSHSCRVEVSDIENMSGNTGPLNSMSRDDNAL
jgi:hypothetical protein